MKKYIAILMVFFFLAGCASNINIKSKPEGADIFIDNTKVGKTPLGYSDTAIAGTTKNIKIVKEGYTPLETVIRKSEFQIGPCIGGLFVLFPLYLDSWLSGNTRV